MRFLLLQCLAHAAAKHGARFLLNLAPGGDVLYEIAVETWDEYQRNAQDDGLRAELQALAQAPAEEVRRVIGDTVRTAAADHPATVREALSAYLAQVPAAVRRSLRRPSDPSGTTAPPDLALRRPDDLMQYLPARPPRFKPGQRPLPGVDWELEELLGIGGFGEVWKARHPFLKSKPPVALKFCLDASAVAALRNEAGILDRVMQHGRHAGIVPLLHTYLSAEPPCLEYEFVEGGDLASLIQEMHARGRVKPAVANRLLLRLAEIVAFAHQAKVPIVHGDLKPANVLVRRIAEGKMALRITDFGIGGLATAQAAAQTRHSQRSRPELLTEAVRGAYTPLYASPEQMRRRPGEHADPRDDVHALGVIWYQLLTGDLAMTSIPPDWREQLVERGVGADLVRILGSCLSPKADKRPASAAVLVQQVNDADVPMLELADVGAGLSAKPRGTAAVVARPSTKSEPKGEPTRPRRPTGATQPAREPAPVAGRSWASWAWGCAGASVVGLVLIAVLGLLARSWWLDSEARAVQQALNRKDQGVVPPPPQQTKDAGSGAFAVPDPVVLKKDPAVVGLPDDKDPKPKLPPKKVTPAPPAPPVPPAVKRAGLAIFVIEMQKPYAAQWGLPSQSQPQVAVVLAGGGGARMGVERDDVVLRINHRDVLTVDQAEKMLRALKLGEPVELAVVRGGKERLLTGSNATEFPEAEELPRLLALAVNDPRVQALVGYRYALGTGMAKNDAEAVQWFRKAAEQGNAIGQANLGFHYEKGLGVPKLEEEAIKWYRKAAAQDNALGQYNLGVCYEDGVGVPKDKMEAVRWYKKAADQGDAAAQNDLGWMYVNGLGVPKNEVEAVRWYKKAAARDDPAGQTNLAWMYEKGLGGLPRDLQEAVRLYRLSAAQGNADAKDNLKRLGN